MNAAEKLAKGIIANYNNQLQGSTIDVPAHVESLLQSLGATTSRQGNDRDVEEVGRIQVSIDSVGFVATNLALTDVLAQ